MKFKKYIENMEFESYGKDHDDGKDIIFDCSLGVNPFGYPQNADECIAKINFEKIHNYPESDFKIKSIISNYWRDTVEITHKNISMGSGSIECLERINKLIIDLGDKVLGYGPQFPEYEFSVKSMGGEFFHVPMNENNFSFECEKFIKNMSKDFKIFYLDNPNNPTGQIISISEIETILKKSQETKSFVIVDEAYGEFMTKENSAVSLINEYENLIVVKSFSKGYGIAGLRMGYLVASEKIMNQLYKISMPFSVNFLALEIGKMLFLDEKFIENSIKETKKIKKNFIENIKSAKILKTDMCTPIFTLVHLNEEIDLKNELYKKGVNIVSGNSFRELSKNSGRIRICKEYKEVIKIINSIE